MQQVERSDAVFIKSDYDRRMDLAQVTLTQMRYAVAVEETRSFRAAADRSHVSQSGLSMQIHKLEELLEIRLFDRSKKPVLVTPEGEPALAQMRAVLRETERLGSIIAEHDELAGPYRLGVIPTLASSVLPLFLREFVDRYPRLDLTIEELQTDVMLGRLRADTLDAGIAATPLNAAGSQEMPLGYEPFFAYLPPGDPLLRKRSVSEADLSARELWVMPEGHCFRTQVLSFCDARAFRGSSRVHFESGSFETLVRLVDGGLGATILPALVVQQLPDERREAQVRRLAGPTPTREIGLVTGRADLRARVNAALAELVRERLNAALGARPRRSIVLSPVD
jgi:LysR family transcriptional regulator, hydrogen peroxide-inducible genes activator